MSSENPRTVQVRTVVVWALVAVAIVALVVWSSWSGLVNRASRPLIEAALAERSGTESVEEPISGSDASNQPVADAARNWESVTGAPPIWPADFASPRECTEVDRNMMGICRTLDGREYIKGRIQAGGVCAFLRGVSDDLGATTPELASELKSYPAMLQNVFHLFRTLGPKRLALLREISNKELADQEAIAFTTFQWLVSRERCTQAVPSDITLDGLYDYAGFVMQTMGGQAYLHRRAPATEALASFYALVVLDLAVEEGINPHGIDPRSELARCRELIASGSFVFRDRYLEVLDSMIVKWNARVAN